MTNKQAWSNLNLPMSNIDYIAAYDLNAAPPSQCTDGAYEFPGASLTVGKEKVFCEAAHEFTIPVLRLENKAQFWPLGELYDDATAVVKGRIHVLPTSGASDNPMIRVRRCSIVDIEAELTGTGNLQVQPNANNATNSVVVFDHDNSAFLGKIRITSNTYTNDMFTKGQTLVLKQANNVGGPLEAFTEDALEIRYFSTLKVTNDVEFATKNRGIRITLTESDVVASNSYFNAGLWEDGKAPHEGADYEVNPNFELYCDQIPFGDASFAGASLYLAKMSKLRLAFATDETNYRSYPVTVNQLYMDAGCTICPDDNSDSTYLMRGKATVFATSKSPAIVRTSLGGGRYEMAMTLEGGSAAYLRCRAYNGTSGDFDTFVDFTGDTKTYQGTIEVALNTTARFGNSGLPNGTILLTDANGVMASVADEGRQALFKAVEATKGKRPVLDIAPMKNRSGETSLNMSSITDSVRMRLIRSRLFRFVDRSTAGADIKIMDEQAQLGLTDSRKAIKPGKQLAAEMYLTGTLYEMYNQMDRNTDRYYKFSMILKDLSSGEIIWTDEQEIRKVATRSVF